jgi:DNA-binding NtrC family response regulator
MKFILAASGDKRVWEVLKDSFGSDYKVDTAPGKEACFDAFQKKRYEFLFLDMEFLGECRSIKDFTVALNPFWDVFPTMEIIVMTVPEKIRDAVMAVKAGATNYLTYPINPEEVKYVIESLQESARMESELDYLRNQFWQSDSLDVVNTKSEIMKGVFDKIRSVAPTKTNVLLLGETGTGKSLLAKLIHRHSNRSHRQFISVHCGAIAEALVESELFGHEKGAFTGAIRRKLGKFEISHEGTIFLDEIGTISPAVQVKLLGVLQDKVFQRVGGEADIHVDVRILAATNSDLKEMNNRSLFRSDLYYRLSVFPIVVPPLRDRREDIPVLTRTLLKRLNRNYMKEIREVHPQVLQAFDLYPWPGNIRELENLIERAHILETSSVLTPESFPADLFSGQGIAAPVVLDTSLSLAQARRRGIERIEKEYFRELLSIYEGRIQKTAKAAGITPRQLHKLMIKHGIRKEDFKPSRASRN